jgi:hypothetical protein
LCGVDGFHNWISAFPAFRNSCAHESACNVVQSRCETHKHLEKKFCFTDWWGPRLYDARGNQIDSPNRPRLPIQVGKPIRFFRDAAEALGYRAGETSEIEVPEAGESSDELRRTI